MTDTDHTPPGAPRPHVDGRELHEQAVADAEALGISHALAPYGILSHDELRNQCHAAGWHQGSFEHALHKAVAAGLIEALAGGFYRDVVHLGPASHAEPTTQPGDAPRPPAA